MSVSTLARAGGLSVVAVSVLLSIASTGPDPEAVRACEDFTEVVCERMAACSDLTVSDCEDELEKEVGDCSEAIALKGEDDLDDCLDAIEETTCAEIASAGDDWMPSDCDDVEIYLPEE